MVYCVYLVLNVLHRLILSLKFIFKKVLTLDLKCFVYLCSN